MSNEEYRIAVLGSGGVGKTCLVLRLTRQTFDPEYIPTIQDYFEKKLVVDNEEYTTKIIDTAGQDEMQGITDIGIKDAQACIIVYSVTSQLSFNEVDKFRDKVRTFSQDNNSKIVLVGNKCDMQERVVTQDQGKKKAAEWGDVPFFETSAKKDINVQDSFIAALKLLVDKKGGAAPAGKGGKGSSDDGGSGGCCNIA
ncbi:hypothetical protein M9Y10_044713 [Tritrichomonas musculus]|uniref:Uncharacterized protein n=1 Tax=Tritrichomonas musculus TaxID=1915356 RepID=A0ABR2JTX1_9EUKA